MTTLPYMRQLPLDYARSRIVTPAAVIAAPIPLEETFIPPIPILGTPLPPPTGGGIPEAPTDGGTYARLNATWTSDLDGGAY
jgi:hypothetical protein